MVTGGGEGESHFFGIVVTGKVTHVSLGSSTLTHIQAAVIGCSRLLKKQRSKTRSVFLSDTKSLPAVSWAAQWGEERMMWLASVHDAHKGPWGLGFASYQRVPESGTQDYCTQLHHEHLDCLLLFFEISIHTYTKLTSVCVGGGGSRTMVNSVLKSGPLRSRGSKFKKLSFRFEKEYSNSGEDVAGCC